MESDAFRNAGVGDMTTKLTESALEETALGWFAGLGYSVLFGPDIEPEKPGAERQQFTEVVLPARLRDAVNKLNPELPADAVEEVIRKVTTPESPSLVENNRAFHRMLVEGVPVEIPGADGPEHVTARLIDFDDPEANEWLVVNQFTVVEGQFKRRPDAVVFVNGLPLAVVELKNPADENATIWTAYSQLQTYKNQISSLFAYNEALVVSDGLEARIGTLTANKEWFMPWRTIKGETLAPETMLELEVLIKGVFDKRRFQLMWSYT